MLTISATVKAFVLFTALAWLALFPARGFDQTYWVWQRTQPLQAGEARDLQAAGVTRLYWHAGTVKWDGTAWRWIERLHLDWPALRASCPGMSWCPCSELRRARWRHSPRRAARRSGKS